MSSCPPKVAWARRHDPTVGPYLRALRENAGFNLGDAAAIAGLPRSTLHNIERGGRFRASGPEMLDPLADAYGVERAVLYRRAGFMEVDLGQLLVGAEPGDAAEPGRPLGYQLGWDAAVAAVLVSARELSVTAPPDVLAMRAEAAPSSARSEVGLERQALEGLPTPYQCGRRDALVEFAGALEALAADACALAGRLQASAYPGAAMLAVGIYEREAAYRATALLARRAADDLPHVATEPSRACGGSDAKR
jgi:transcriptional regulator with XRE-family HTH domain